MCDPGVYKCILLNMKHLDFLLPANDEISAGSD